MKTEYVDGIQLLRPYIDEDNREFWEAHKENKLVFQTCANCGQMIHRPRPMCPYCLATEKKWVESTGIGTVYSWVVFVYDRAAYPGIKVPYIVVLVEMAEGPRVISNMEGVEPEDMYVGMPVEVFFEKIDEDLTLPKFKKRKVN
ncbi:MAG: nucleic acid-binding protein [Deltaproteobacteria bacterium]|nr:nucleic acid-binding protein [Deltaproteobacteria bacterium]